MVEKAYASSVEEKDRLVKEGYAVVAIAGFQPAGPWTFTLEKGSEWSRMLGSK